MLRNKLRAKVALVLVLFGLTACKSPNPGQSALAAPLVWGGPKNISMLPIVADKMGFFREEGLNVQPRYLQTGKVAMDAVVSGDLNLGVIVETNIAFVKFQQGADIKVVASLLQKHDDAIIARADKGIRKPKDLEGKALAIIPGTTSQRFASLFVDFYHLDPGRIQLLNQTSPAGIQASVLNGSIPAGAVWEPYRYNVQQALGGKVVQFSDPRIYTAYGLLAVRGDFATREATRIVAFLRALIKAETFVKEHREEAIDLLGKEIDIDPKVLAAVWDDYELKVGLDDSLVKVFEDTGRWAKNTQPGFEAKTVPEYTDVLDADFLRRIDPARTAHAPVRVQ